MLLLAYQRSRRRPPRPLEIRDALSIDCYGSVVTQRRIWISSWVQSGRRPHHSRWSVLSSHWNHITAQCVTYPPPPYGLPVLQQQQQQQQKRYVGKGLPHIRKQAKKYGYTNDDAKLQICYSDYDLLLDTELEDAFDEDSEDMTFAKVKFNLSGIKQAVEEIYDDSRQLQYYDRAEHKWHPLTDLEAAHLQPYRGGKQVLKVRVPEYYDNTPMVMGNEQDHDEDLDFDPNDENRLLKPKAKKEGLLAHHPPDMVAMYLEGTIKSLVVQLKESGHVRADGVIYGDQGHQETMFAVRHPETNEKMSTRDYVVQVATRPQNRLLARLLLAVPGALDHVVRGMHYDVLWEPRYVPRRPRYRTKYRPR